MESNILIMKWISVKDRLPTHKKTVLTCGSIYSRILDTDEAIINCVQTTGCYVDGEWILEGDKHPIWGQPFYYTKITHWMPLPESPNQ